MSNTSFLVDMGLIYTSITTLVFIIEIPYTGVHVYTLTKITYHPHTHIRIYGAPRTGIV